MTSKTAEEKAKELVNKFKKHSRIVSDGFLIANQDTQIKEAKQCALIAVDEILNQFTWRPSTGMSYWQKVENEIKKL